MSDENIEMVDDLMDPPMQENGAPGNYPPCPIPTNEAAHDGWQLYEMDQQVATIIRSYAVACAGCIAKHGAGSVGLMQWPHAVFEIPKFG